MKERLRVGSEVFHSLKMILKSKELSTNVGDEGGFAPDLSNAEEAFELIIQAINDAGYKPSDDVNLTIDVAANSLYCNSKYKLDGKFYTSLELVDYYAYLCDKYPIISIEDAFYEDDWDGFKILTERIGDRVQLVGDDLFVTSKKYLSLGIKNKCCNAILIKPNQVGTVSEVLETIDLAHKNGYKTIISHRSGETEDTTISDLAVGLNLGQIKAGSLSRIERVIKYNRLLMIESEI